MGIITLNQRSKFLNIRARALSLLINGRVAEYPRYKLDSLPSADSSVALLPQNDKGEKPQKSRKRKAHNDTSKCY